MILSPIWIWNFLTAKLSYILNFLWNGQVGALSAVEAKKRFEFLEAVGSAMDAHLRYFKQVFI